MQIQENFPLKQYNTFGIDAKAKSFVSVTSVDELRELISSGTFRNGPVYIWGGGSNILLTKDFEGTIVKIDIMGKKLREENPEEVRLEVGAGENWHELVTYCIGKNYYGMENLALIPGTVGAAPIQNIGAYGVELKEVVEEVKGVDIETNEERSFRNEECEFGYRSSVFKTRLRGRFIVTSVIFRLRKSPSVNIGYKDVSNELAERKVSSPTPKDVYDAVVAVRTRKLPDPKVVGNAGSFFKNPYISKEQFAGLQKNFPDIPSFPVDENTIKVPAAWLIEQCGWKGHRNGDAGVYPKQALVLCNYGGAQGAEIAEISVKIRESVREKFGIDLEPEVWIL